MGTFLGRMIRRRDLQTPLQRTGDLRTAIDATPQADGERQRVLGLER